MMETCLVDNSWLLVNTDIYIHQIVFPNPTVDFCLGAVYSSLSGLITPEV
jgi:hypothetical protein